MMTFDEVQTTLQQLSQQGGLRQIDYQFARFITAQCPAGQLSEAQRSVLLLVAAAVSAELGRGHICLPLRDEQGNALDLAARLGLFGDAALPLNQLWLACDWAELVKQCTLLGVQGEAVPLMYDGERLYLHRYWHYEVTLAQRLQSFGTPMILKPAEVDNLRLRLDNLFARDYRFLHQALSPDLNQVARQRLVCDLLDVVDEGALDWDAIDAKLQGAPRLTDLNVLDSLVPQAHCLNWQKVAAAIALTRRFAVISGGPGTGKTTTVTKLLAALISQSQQQGHIPAIKLVAPTGKAAARLTESIGKAVADLAVEPELKALIPTESSTIHRLLGAIPDSAEFRHHAANRLHLDVLVVDEASMVDLPMMVKLVDALPAHARLILLGDKDQLASVEAGAVLGDICSFLQQGYSAEQSQLLARLTGFMPAALNPRQDEIAAGARAAVSDSLCMLQKSYRFDARSGIGQLAKAVNSGQAMWIDRVWQQDFADIAHFALSSEHYHQMLQSLVAGYTPYLQRLRQPLQTAESDRAAESMADKAREVLTLFSQTRLLCALREGDFGVTGLNVRIERALAARKLIKVQDELWYSGRPVMVTRNDHALGLYNGDIGICLRDEQDDQQRLKVYFELPDGSVKAVLPSRVPLHETAYAMTIHKSQGSEFDFTLLIIPPEFSPILTRELVYTGITRAKRRLALYCDMGVMKRAIKLKTQRASGLVQRLSAS
ncbi:exodeoxyribonuclease V subunit alpha [Stutzerimonas xanthomarina]|uniref:exodeoxyribonuclease V subunit alpha n=1 Tax=Stutzerimonas xanthomarina TaxID=271420 RepID=UPI003AA8A98A